jgi:hypothetical protein
MANSTSAGTSGNSQDATGPAATPESSGPTTTGPDSSSSAGSAGAAGLRPGERDN